MCSCLESESEDVKESLALFGVLVTQRLANHRESVCDLSCSVYLLIPISAA